ncbi:hypothetical protein [Plesiomonas sp. PI-19]|uniref:hypothetical protein n=1 Tax=Plesiomonas sp. PI-19 TaxID=2898798 RepID=UPI001F289B3A|nr:hypothetical protein [Plesiomonas sp. PI-19]MCE5165596.1 hypothetical protein [Plesiomonas sp. PI-19]
MVFNIPINILLCARQFSNKIILSGEQSNSFLVNCPDVFFDLGIEVISYSTIKDSDGKVVECLQPSVVEHNMQYWPIISNTEFALNNPKYISAEFNSSAIEHLSSIVKTTAPELNTLLEWMKKNKADSWLVVGLSHAKFAVAGIDVAIENIHINLSEYILARSKNDRSDSTH